MFVSAGCFHVHQGRYEAQVQHATGWEKREYAGRNIFTYPTTGIPKWNVGLGGRRKGTLYVIIDSGDSRFWKLARFSGAPIRVIFHDHNEERVMSAEGFESPFGQEFEIGDSQDFTVILPSFTIG
ncbi:MAG: hypothetical protein ACK4UN_12375, partial [Limisphaerales bacterium]